MDARFAKDNCVGRDVCLLGVASNLSVGPSLEKIYTTAPNNRPQEKSARRVRRSSVYQEDVLGRCFEGPALKVDYRKTLLLLLLLLL